MNLIKIWQLKTQNGRIFRVMTENPNQENRVKSIISENKDKYENFVEVDIICNGIHTIKNFEKLAETLV